jgi:hypothetical protein
VAEPEVIGLLEESLELLPPGDSARRAMVSARLAVALYVTDQRDRLDSLSKTGWRRWASSGRNRRAAVPEEQLLAAIEEAVGVSLLEEHTQGRDVRYRFTHAYFRRTLNGEMIAPRLLRLNNDVSKALDAHYATRLDEHAVELIRAALFLARELHHGRLTIPAHGSDAHARSRRASEDR